MAESTSEKILKSVNIWHSYGSKSGLWHLWRSLTFSSVAVGYTKCTEQPPFCLLNIHRFKKNHLLTQQFTFFKIWLLITPPHLNYAAAFLYTLSLIACFLILMFHKVVWQHNYNHEYGDSLFMEDGVHTLHVSMGIASLGCRWSLGIPARMGT